MIDHRQPVLIPEDRQWLPLLQTCQKQFDLLTSGLLVGDLLGKHLLTGLGGVEPVYQRVVAFLVFGLIEEKGFFILPSELFRNVCEKAAQDDNLNETLETVFRHIEDSAKGSYSESDFSGLFDDFDVNSNKLGATVSKRNERLCKLLWGVRDMALGDRNTISMPSATPTNT